MSLLHIDNLNVSFRIKDDIFHVVKDFFIDVESGDRIALVGESGSGKSVVASAIFGILERNAISDGSIVFNGRDLSGLTRTEFDLIRRKEMVLIPQNISQAWDPLIKIGKQMMEFITASGIPKAEAKERAEEFLLKCGFEEPHKIMDTYPHRLSGGMSQRAMIAMCMSVRPKLVVADEPTKGLDESVRENVLDLLMSDEWNASILMITHDIYSASRCERIMVMYSGRSVESGISSDVLERPMHPYTKGLMDSEPSKGLKAIPFASRDIEPGECSFANRCIYSDEKCTNDCIRYGDREVRCHRAGDL